MKRFVLTTTSESSDHYIYFIEHEGVPTADELDIFLRQNGNDVETEGEDLYEYIDNLVELPKEFLTIPKN